MTQVDVTDVPDAARYDAHVGDELAGVIVYDREPGVVTMRHTEVFPQWEHHGVGSQLVQGALDLVRAAGERVRPVCPFVASWLGEHPDYAELVAD